MKNSLLKNKNFALTFFGALVSNIGSLLYSFAVSFYILNLSSNNSFIQGSYLAVCGITFVIVSLFSGVLSDHFNKAKIMVICDYLKGFIIGITTLLMYFFANSNDFKIVLLFILGIISNIIAAIFSPASSSLLPFIVRKDDLQKANSYFAFLNSLQNIAGVLLAGILYSILDMYTLFLLVSLCYIGSAISEMFIKYDYKKDDNKLTIKEVFSDIKDGFIYIHNDKAVMALCFTCLFINFFFNPIFDNFVPYFVSSDISGSSYLFNNFITPEIYSSIFTIAFGVGYLIASLVISNYKIKNNYKIIRKNFILISSFLLAYSLIFEICNHYENTINIKIISFLIIALLIGILVVFINVPTSTSLQKKTDPAMLGKVNGVLNVGSMGLTPLASFLAGLVLSYSSMSALLFICTFGFIFTTIFFSLNKSARGL